MTEYLDFPTYLPDPDPDQFEPFTNYYLSGCRRGIGGAPKGRAPWNKGLKGAQPCSIESRNKMSVARKGRPNSNKAPFPYVACIKCRKVTNVGNLRHHATC
jgi:hypothetical protein